MTLRERIRQMAGREDGVTRKELHAYAPDGSIAAALRRMKRAGELRSAKIDAPRSGPGRPEHVYVLGK